MVRTRFLNVAAAATLINRLGYDVIACQNPADAASPVSLFSRRNGVRQIGQSADYRHDITSTAEAMNAVQVEGYWNQEYQQWETCIDGLPTEDEEKIKLDLYWAKRRADDAAVRKGHGPAPATRTSCRSR